MVRVYVKKTTRGQYGKPTQDITDALKAISDGAPLIRVSKEFNIPARTLRRHRDGKVGQPGTVILGRHVPALPNQIEKELHDHIQMMEHSMYGLTVNDVKRLAFEIAESYHLKHPFSQANSKAGRDWLCGFFKRHPDLVIRSPQGTNLARAVAFNRPKVQQFFEVYEGVLQQRPFLPSQIWNMDETGITNVHQPRKIVATKGARQVSKVTSGERGATVTVICAISAAGTYLPPMMIFPRKRMVDTLMVGAPPQSLGCCSTNGWTDSSLFVKWLQHFVQFTNSSPTSQHIIVMDGHHSHKTLAAINYAREFGIHLIALPPHSTHKMQPLDRTVFKSLKSAYNSAADSWMSGNCGKRISFFNMAGIFGQAFLRTATPDKAIHGFQVCGLWPFNKDVFTEEDFAAAAVTEEDQPATSRTTSVVPTTSDQLSRSQTSSVQMTSDQMSINQTSVVQSMSDQASTNQTLSVQMTSDQISTNQISVAQIMSDQPSTSHTSSVQMTSDQISVDQSSVIQTMSNQPLTSQTSLLCSASAEDARKIIKMLSPRAKLQGPRARTRKVESAALVTSSPYKQAVMEKEAMTQKRQIKSVKPTSQPKKPTIKKKITSAKTNRQQSQQADSSTSEDDDDAWPCLICGESYSRPREVWLQCQVCHLWAHKDCTEGGDYFVCPNCNSDDDVD
jgi:hypothetical protein